MTAIIATGSRKLHVGDVPVPSTPTRARRLQRELKTVHAMIGIYCHDHHGETGTFCADCEPLWQYAQQRVDRCPFGIDKPTCAKCTVHCYQSAMRERIRMVMRYAGPRMMWRHPWLTLLHVLHGRERAPRLKRSARGR
ncbi:MAG: nitrous oxide-stimulated promoter family protein [Polyangiaceae bacterium]|nr:nitrous oxide-stimulated promoter family protein [Polyangiaceae bacterium]